MASTQSSPDDLLQKLAGYKSKLKQVEDLCAANPTNEDFIKLRADLIDVIKLTSELVTLSGSKQQPRNAIETPSGLFEPGQRVEAQSAAAGGIIWYPGVVTARHANEQVSVKYIGFGSEEQLAAAAVRPLLPHPSAAIAAREVKAGMKVTAKYAGDGQWYAARVEEVISSDPTLAIVEQAAASSGGSSEGGAVAGEAAAAGVGALWRVLKVTYLQYNSSETVPLEYIRHTGGGAGTGSAAELEGAAAAAAAAAGDTFDIPDHLRLLPTDSEAERKRKRRAVKGLKLKHKTNVVVAAAASRKGSWQDFQSKLGGKGKKGGGSKRVRGFISSAPGLSKSKSIFATTDKPSAVDVEAAAAKKPRRVDA